TPDLGGGRNRGECREPLTDSEPFVTEHEVRSILAIVPRQQDRARYNRAELILTIWWLGFIEIVSCIQFVVSEKLPNSAVKIIPPRNGTVVNDAAMPEAARSVRISPYYPKLRNGIDCGQDILLIEVNDSVPDTIQQILVLIKSATIDADAEASAREGEFFNSIAGIRFSGSGGQKCQLQNVAAI